MSQHDAIQVVVNERIFASKFWTYAVVLLTALWWLALVLLLWWLVSAAVGELLLSSDYKLHSTQQKPSADLKLWLLYCFPPPSLSLSLSPSPVISSAPLVAPVSIVHVQVKVVELNYPANIFAMMFETRMKADTILRKEQLINAILHLTALNSNE